MKYFVVILFLGALFGKEVVAGDFVYSDLVDVGKTRSFREERGGVFFCLKTTRVEEVIWNNVASLVPRRGMPNVTTEEYSDIAIEAGSIYIPMTIDEGVNVRTDEAVSLFYETEPIAQMTTGFTLDVVKAGRRLYVHTICPNGEVETSQIHIPGAMGANEYVSLSLLIRANGVYLASKDQIKISNHCGVDPGSGYVDLVQISHYTDALEKFNWNLPRTQACTCTPAGAPDQPPMSTACKHKNTSADTGHTD